MLLLRLIPYVYQECWQVFLPDLLSVLPETSSRQCCESSCKPKCNRYYQLAQVRRLFFALLFFMQAKLIVSIASVIAGLATVVLIYLLSRGNSFSIGRLILIGIGIQAMLDALISYLTADWCRTRSPCSNQMAQWQPKWLSNARTSTSLILLFSSLHLSL